MAAKLALLAVIAAVAWRLGQGIDWALLGDRLAKVDRPLAAAAALLLAARAVAWGERWGVALARIGEPSSPPRRWAAVAASVAVNHATPYLRVFGAIFRARYLSRVSTLSFGTHYGVVLFDQLAHGLGVALLLWGVGVGLAWSLGARSVALGGAAAGVLVGIVVVGKLRSSGARRGSPLVEMVIQKARTRAMRFRQLAEHGRGLVKVMRRLVGDPGVLRRMLVWSFVYAGLNAAAQWLVFRALGVEINPLAVIAVVGGGVIVGAVTGSPGGLATTEAAMAAGFISLGLAQTDAAAGTLIYRGLHYLVVVATGVPSLLFFEAVEGGRLRGRGRSDAAAPPESDPPEPRSRPDQDR